MNWYLQVLKNYTNFSGRARRKEFWYFFLFNTLIIYALAYIDRMTGIVDQGTGVGLLTGIYGLATLVPNLAVYVRRLHDSGKSGWWIFLIGVPLRGSIVVLFFLVRDSNPASNKYGENPK